MTTPKEKKKFTNVKYYFYCRHKLETSTTEIQKELEQLFETNVMPTSLEITDTWLKEYNNEKKRKKLFKFDNQNQIGFGKLMFNLSESKSDDLKMQFYSLCRYQLQVSIPKILEELKRIYDCDLPNLNLLNIWVVNNWKEQITLRTVEIEDVTPKSLAVEFKSSNRASTDSYETLSKNYKIAQNTIFELRDKLASMHSKFTQKPVEIIKEEMSSQSMLLDISNFENRTLNSDSNEQKQLKDLKKNISHLQDTVATLQYDKSELVKQISDLKKINTSQERIIQRNGSDKIDNTKLNSLVDQYDKHLAESQSNMDQVLKRCTELELKNEQLVKSLDQMSQKCDELKKEKKQLEEENKHLLLKHPEDSQLNNKEDLKILSNQIENLKKQNEILIKEKSNLKQEHSKAVEYAKTYCDNLQHFEENLIKERKVMDETKKNYSNEITDLKLQYDETISKMSNLEQEKSNSQLKYANLFNLYTSQTNKKLELEKVVQDMNNEVLNLSNRNKNMEFNLQNCSKIPLNNGLIEKLQNDLVQLRNQYDTLKTHLNERNILLANLETNFLKNKQDFEEKLMEKESANVILAEQLKNIQLDLEQNDEELNENEKQHKIIVQDFESQIKTLKESNNESQTSIAQFEAEVAELKKNIKQNEDKFSNQTQVLKDSNDKLETNQSELKKAKESNEEFKQKCLELEAKLSTAYDTLSSQEMKSNMASQESNQKLKGLFQSFLSKNSVETINVKEEKNEMNDLAPYFYQFKRLFENNVRKISVLTEETLELRSKHIQQCLKHEQDILECKKLNNQLTVEIEELRYSLSKYKRDLIKPSTSSEDIIDLTSDNEDIKPEANTNKLKRKLNSSLNTKLDDDERCKLKRI